MPARLLPFDEDPIHPAPPTPVTITVDGVSAIGVAGQSLAESSSPAASSVFAEPHPGRPRGVFCGIGVCFDCLVEVNGHRDVRACQRRAVDGDVVTSQHDPLPSGDAS